MDKNNLHIQTSNTTEHFKIMQQVLIDYGYKDEKQLNLKYGIKILNDYTIAIIDAQTKQGDLYFYDFKDKKVKKSKIF